MPRFRNERDYPTTASVARVVILAALVSLLAFLLTSTEPARAEPTSPHETFLRRAFALPGADTATKIEMRLFEDANDGQLNDFTLLEAALVACGAKEQATLDEYSEKLAAVSRKLDKRIRHVPSTGERAKLVFAFMHRELLRGGYRLDSTDPRQAFDLGRFNCVSASVLYNCLAESQGLTVSAMEFPGHVMSRVSTDDGPIDVETTCPRWFSLMGDPRRQDEMVEETLGHVPQRDGHDVREVSPAQLVAMVYYNRGVDLLATKEFLKAVTANVKALRLDPTSVTARGNLLATLNNWAIFLSDDGDHAEAIDLLRKAMDLAPHYETFMLNFVHIHHQWIEQLCESKKYSEAIDLLAETSSEYPEQEYFRVAPWRLYRRWGEAVILQRGAEAVFEIFDEARRKHGPSSELTEVEIAVVNDRALALLEAQSFEDAISLFDLGLSRIPMSKLLGDNRRVAIMRWAEPAFAEGDYEEAIRRTTHGATNGQLHPMLAGNVRYGYRRWIESLRESGQDAQAEALGLQVMDDPFVLDAELPARP